MLPDAYPDKLESGTANLPGIWGLKKGLDYISSVGGEETIHSKEKYLCRVLKEDLYNIKNIHLYDDISGLAPAPVIAFNLKNIGCEVDPLRFDLIFERFLNVERVSMPDFDIDFCYVRRPEVIEDVTKKYRGKVADMLNKDGVAVRAGYHCAYLAHKTFAENENGVVRVSIGWFNTKKDIKILVNSLNKIAKRNIL